MYVSKPEPFSSWLMGGQFVVSPLVGYTNRTMKILFACGSIAISTKAKVVYMSGQDAGASPFFPPVHDSIETAAPDVQGYLYRSPRLYGVEQSRWDLRCLRDVIPWLRQTVTGHSISLPGLSKLLKRLGVSYKRGRAYVHSPDLEYNKKVAYIESLKKRNASDPHRFPLLYEDEFTFYRRPTIGKAYAARRSVDGGARAKQGTRYNLISRIAGCLDVNTGQVIARQRNRYVVKEMYRFFFFVNKHYPDAERIYIVLDNWDVHFHPYVLEHLAKSCPRIELVRLPTYAPWLNPIEKLWLRLYQKVLDQHSFQNNWEGLKEAVKQWLAQYEHGSQELLQMVGLTP
jgi:hypothetical protein